MSELLNPKQQNFISLAASAGYTSPLSRPQIKALRAKHKIPMPVWLMKDDSRRVGHGKYECPELSQYLAGTPLDTITLAGSASFKTPKAPRQPKIKVHQPVVTPAPAAAAPTEVQAAFAAPPLSANNARSIGHVLLDLPPGALVPEKVDTFVPFGHFRDLEAIIRSNRFYTVYVTGLSGNGKTMCIEQACAKANRECIRVNIIATTDEDDLLGGFRLVDGETKWQDGPVIVAMKRGAVLLLDEVDLGTDKMMCLQPVLEGNSVFLKKINQKVVPAPGFTVIATANTKGQGGQHSDRFAGTRILNEAFLERFKATLDQEYPSKTVELKILRNLMEKYSCVDEPYANMLVDWASLSRKTFEEGACEDLITTRRLCHIIDNFSIFGDRMKAVEQSVARFQPESREALTQLYKKLDQEAAEKARLAMEAQRQQEGAAPEIVNEDALSSAARVNLGVTYAQRHEVKSRGARFDGTQKVWYITGAVFAADPEFWKRYHPVVDVSPPAV